MPKHLFVCLFAVAALSLAPREAAANEFNFDCITGNSATDCAILESQLTVSITSTGSMVKFLFENSGPYASSITDIYFDDPPPLLDPWSVNISYPSGGIVAFTEGTESKCSPGSLPGGGNGFVTAYCADSDSPTQPNGVNPGESVMLSYTYTGGGDALTGVLAAINAGTFAIGIHVQGFADGGSVSGIMPGQPVPEPASLLLMGGGAVAAAFARRRRKTA